MKKISFVLALFAVASLSLTGCLKDKGFENNEYGINDPDTQPPGVGFPFGAKARNDFGLDVTTGTQNVVGYVYVNLEAGNPASSDVAITLTNNTAALLTKYNTDNNLSGSSAILALPTALYTVPLSLTIPSGGRNAQVTLSVTNTTGLDANRLYAAGFTISTVTGGYKIAENLKNLFIVFSVKNAYDGRYNLRGKFHHPSGANPAANFATTVEMHTTGPNTVLMYWPLGGGYGSPMIFGGSLNWFGAQTPQFTVNTATNAVVVNNTDPTGPVYAMSSSGFLGGPYIHRWDPATKTFYASWGYNLGAGGVFGGNGSASRLWEDTLIRTGPR